MAAPVADVYTAPAGATIYGGRLRPGGRLSGSATLADLAAAGDLGGGAASVLAGQATLGDMSSAGSLGTPAIVIVGNQWTPNRDGSGNVLSSDLQQMPLNTWYYVNDTQAILDTVIETPHLTKSNGADSAPSIVDAWSGMAWDRANGVGYISGGGHSNGHPCETGVYTVSSATLRFTRLIDRAPVNLCQYWGGSSLVAGVPANYPDHNNPLIDGRPGSWHTYDGLEYIPASALGNTKGGIYYGANAKTVIDLDSLAYKTTTWQADNVQIDDWSYGMAFYDSGAIWRPRSGNTWARHLLSGTQASSWSATSFGQYSISYANSLSTFTYGSKIFVRMPERREVVSIAGNQAAVRVRVGQAVDAGATTWTSYHDAITLTSVNATDHLDFSSANLLDVSNSVLCSAGAWYDHAGGCIWICANTVGGALYKITGLSGSTWTVEKVVGPSALSLAGLHTYGKFVGWNVGSVKMAMRFTTTTGKLEVIRLA